MKHGTLTIHFQHYWHCGSGQAGEGDVDLLPIVEDCGLPYVPGRAIRGRLKWAAREAGWSEDLMDAFFGRENAKNIDSMGRLHIANATMRDAFAVSVRAQLKSSANIPLMVSALFEDIASTSLKDGVAEAKMLRRVRYAVPVSVIADVSLKESGDVTWERLKELAGKLRAVGKGKHDGFGWCRAALSDASVPEDKKAPPDSTAFHLEMTLLDDVVLSANSATVGGHRTLDHVPGSALMGAFARGYFKALRDKAPSTAEHVGAEALLTGRISFGNGVPIGSGGVPTVPVPLSWHHAKIQAAVADELVQDEAVSNLAAVEYNKSILHGEQPVQMREGWLDSAAGRLIPVPRTQTLKTAIDPSLAKYEIAKESALYSYEAIEKDTRFVSRIELNSADADLCTALRDAFDGKTIRLGRSKGTEFGRAKCKLTNATPVGAASATGDVILLAESDLALLDDNGFPTLRPEPSYFGLCNQPSHTRECSCGWWLCEQRTFLRFRRYSLWNAKRGGPDVERQVISKGSVIVFTNSDPSASATLRPRAGLGQAEGLGRVRLDDWLKEERPAFTNPGAKAPDAHAQTHPAIGEDITSWVNDRHREQQFDIEANKLGHQWSNDWRAVARKKGASISASQWGRLDEAARDSRDKAALLQKLGQWNVESRETIFGHGRKRKEWSKGDDRSLASVIRQSLDAQTDDCLALAAFRSACHRMAAQARRDRD